MPAPPLPRQAEALRVWLATATGRALAVGAQRAWHDPSPAGAAGQFLLRLKPSPDWPHEAPPARFAHAIDLHLDAEGWAGAWRCASDQLPLPNQSVARIELRFVLEAFAAPERLLVECARVLCPEGRLWMVGLDPFGLARLRWGRHGVRAVSPLKMAALLEGEGLTVLDRQTLGARWYPPPLADVGAPLARGGAPGRVAWGLLATRRDASLTPLRRTVPAWRAVAGVPAR